MRYGQESSKKAGKLKERLAELADSLQDEIRGEFELMERNPEYKQQVELAAKSIQAAIDAAIIKQILEKQNETH